MEKNMEKRVVLGMSGGVDSSVSAYLLQKQGYTVIGVTMQLWEKTEDGEMPSSVVDAKKVCTLLGIEHHTVDFREKFRQEVVEQFAEEYAKGNTPNPCVMCNRYLKFGALVAFAKKVRSYLHSNRTLC